MHSGFITTAIVHNLSLAVAYGGTIYGKTALGPAVLQGISIDRERGRVMQIAWNEFNKRNVPAHLALSMTWLVQRNGIKRFTSDRATRSLVTIKDALTLGALVTGVANVAASKMLEREYPKGVPIPAEGNVSPESAAKITRYVNFFRVVGGLNVALLGASIAVGPLLGASIIRSRRRGGLAGRLLQMLEQ